MNNLIEVLTRSGFNKVLIIMVPLLERLQNCIDGIPKYKSFGKRVILRIKLRIAYGSVFTELILMIASSTMDTGRQVQNMLLVREGPLILSPWVSLMISCTGVSSTSEARLLVLLAGWMQNSTKFCSLLKRRQI